MIKFILEKLKNIFADFPWAGGCIPDDLTLEELNEDLFKNNNMKIELLPPLQIIDITQNFGENAVSFYKQLGINGHNGIDYRSKTGTPLFATHGGEVTFSGTDKDGGKCIEIITNRIGDGHKSTYYHLNDMVVRVGDKVNAGELIGHTGNTGKYTTGPHLHYGLKKTRAGVTLNHDNGYWGAIDPTPFFPKDYDQSRAYHCYGRKRNFIAEFNFRFAPQNIRDRWAEAGRYVHRKSEQLLYTIPLSNEKVNALIYGGWDLETVINPALAGIWRWYKKDEWEKIKPR